MRKRAAPTGLADFAARATRGLDTADVFIGVYDDRPVDDARAAFLLQLGYAILHDKQIVVPVPYGVTLPAKLAAIADAVVYYHPHDPASLQHALRQALTELGAVRQ